MARRIRSITALLLSAVAVAGPGLPSASAVPLPGPAGFAFRPVCATGRVRCMSFVRTDLRPVLAPGAAHAGLGPADLRRAYGLVKASRTRGAGQTVGIVDAWDNPNVEADLAAYRAAYGLPPCTTANGCFRKVNQDGEQGHYPPANPVWETEIVLDVQMASAICPRCRIVLVEANTGDEAADSATPVTRSDLGESVDTAANLGATVISNSYGSVGPEGNFTAWDHYYDHPGIAVTASSGDFGWGTAWPASSAFVTAVGGTNLRKAANPRGWNETAWGGSPADGAGSGCSVWEPKPAWQTGIACTGRSEADVAAVADPSTGVAVYDSTSGGWIVVGGTSVASPIIASIYALAGNAASVTYGSYPYAHRTRLWDITTGSNFPVTAVCGAQCAAGPGYDGPTGLGTPHGVGAF